jgi:hypothetical protein
MTWPPQRQADLAEVVALMEEQDRNELHLTDAQAAEVRRRLAEPGPTVPAAEVFRRLRSGP